MDTPMEMRVKRFGGRGPHSDRLGPHSWPTLVIEAGYSESLNQVKQDMIYSTRQIMSSRLLFSPSLAISAISDEKFMWKNDRRSHKQLSQERQRNQLGD